MRERFPMVPKLAALAAVLQGDSNFTCPRATPKPRPPTSENTMSSTSCAAPLPPTLATPVMRPNAAKNTCPGTFHRAARFSPDLPLPPPKVADPFPKDKHARFALSPD